VTGLYLPGDTLVEVAVRGVPVGQGAIRSFGPGRATHANAPVLKPWRQQIQAAIADIIGRDPVPHLGPVMVDATFTIKKPTAAPKRRRTFPTTRPDVDHYIRAVFDAVTASGLWRDDSQVVESSERKVYPGEHPQSLQGPGLVLRVSAVREGQ
jgi:Holliday junction resolvase RusA-like endonuclease